MAADRTPLRPVPTTGTGRTGAPENPPHYDDDTATHPDPHDVGAERAVLALAMRDPAEHTAARNILTHGDWYRPAHELLWDILCTQADHGHPTDPAAILGILRARNELRAIGGDPLYLTNLYTELVVGDAAYHATTIRDHARRRRILTEARRDIQHANDPAWDIDALELERLDRIEQAIDQRLHAGGSGVTYADWTNLLTGPRTPTNWIAAPLLAAGRVTLLYSPGKAGKSLIAQEIACGAALSGGALDTPPTGEPRHVLYVDQEMTPDDWRDRITDMGIEPADIGNLADYLHLAQLQTWPPLDTPAGGAALLAAVAETHAEVVVLDTISKLVSGEENANDTHQALYRHTLMPLKTTGAGVLVLDHTGKDVEKGARGGSAKTDNVDLAFELLTRGHDLLSLRCSHARFRDSQLEGPTMIRRRTQPVLTHIVERREVAPDTSPTALRPTHLMEKASRYIEENPGISGLGIYAAIGGKKQYVYLALDLLFSEGYVTQVPGRVTRSVIYHSITPFREG